MVTVANVRELTGDDAAWAAELMERRREVYAHYSPVFWRPRKGVTGLHERFLRRQIASPANVALRTEHGFIIGQRRGRAGASEGFVDDFAVDEAGSWDGDGAALLLATWQRLQADGAGADADAVRVVTAHADEAKAGMLGRLKLGPVLLLDHLSDDADVTAVEREAAMMGAVLVIVPATPGSARAGQLRSPGWSVASDWYQGRPRVAAA